MQKLETGVQKVKQKLGVHSELQASASSDAQVENIKKLLLERTSLLAIAYYNLGCEFEHLKQIPQSVEAY